MLRVFVQPNATKEEVVGVHGDAVRIRISAVAVDNKANSAIIDFFARYFCVKKSAVRIIKGEKQRQKVVAIYGDSFSMQEKCRGLLEPLGK